MDRREFLGLAAALGAASLAGCASPAGTPTPSSGPSGPAAAHGPLLAGFAASVLAGLAPKPENVVFSPWSIALALSMIREGAVGATGAQIDGVLGKAAPALGDALNAQTRAMLGTKSASMHLANALWGQQDLAWQQPFLDRLATSYQAPLNRVDFGDHPDDIRVKINDWVAEQTKDKIKDLLDPGLITSASRMVLVNALHFKADWSHEMDPGGDRDFATPGGTVSAPFVVDLGQRPWFEDADWTGSVQYCTDNEFALVLVLPKKAGATTAVPAELFSKVLASGATEVSLQLPTWKTDFKTQLRPLMEVLGVELAFDSDRADFSAMTTGEKLHLEFLIHQATIEVTATGIEGAAATGGGMEAGAAPSQPKELVLDRPFSYALLHSATGAPLFVGQVADPTAT